MRAHAVLWLGLVVLSAIGRAEEPPIAPAFRVRPYLQNPAPDAMTIRWLSNDDTPGTVRIAGRELVSAPVLSLELAYQPNESRDDRLLRPDHVRQLPGDGSGQDHACRQAEEDKPGVVRGDTPDDLEIERHDHHHP